MAEYIKREDVLKEIKARDIGAIMLCYNYARLDMLMTDGDMLREILDSIPAVDIQPQRKATWLCKKNESNIFPPAYYQCSECGHWVRHPTNFCAECGAKMTGIR